LGDLGAQGWNILNGNVPLPAAVLKESALVHNSRVMRQFTERVGFRLAPHGKTTMAPQLFDRQLRDGAWGMTAATVGHVVTYRRFGVRRILFANQLIDPVGIEFILGELARDPELEFYCLIDSRASAERLAHSISLRDHSRPVQVLIEIGAAGGRTGIRTLEETVALAQYLYDGVPCLQLCGLEAFEGIYSLAADPAAPQKVSTLLQHVRFALERIFALALFAPGPIVVTAGGSVFFEQVAYELRGLRGSRFEVILRSGCYLTHDNGMYDQSLANPLHSPVSATQLSAPLRPALEVWSYIQSRPEKELAIANFGKRDVSYDIALPKMMSWRRPSLHSRIQPLDGTVTVRALNDQHAYLQLPASHPLAVGDLVGAGISHPCTTFDKWQLLYLVDDDYNVLAGIRTFF
jgi:D-serine dehydratase